MLFEYQCGLWPWRPSLKLLSWCPIFLSSQCNSFIPVHILWRWCLIRVKNIHLCNLKIWRCHAFKLHLFIGTNTWISIHISNTIPRFLRGTCQVTNCPFSHRVAPDKMPVCTHFLRGSCSRDPCPYRHVNVARDAEVCPGFLKGFCPNGEKVRLIVTSWAKGISFRYPC